MKDVAIGIINKDNKLLMIKRAKKEDNLDWVFPGGKVESNETKEEACIREVYEETGINVEIIKKLGEKILPNLDIKLTYFLCKYISGNIKILDKTEVIEIEYKDKTKLFQDVKTDIFPPVLDYINKNIN